MKFWTKHLVISDLRACNLHDSNNSEVYKRCHAALVQENADKRVCTHGNDRQIIRMGGKNPCARCIMSKFILKPKSLYNRLFAVTLILVLLVSRPSKDADFPRR